MIKGYNDYYTEKNGTVFSKKYGKNKELVQAVRNGYLTVNLCMNGKYSTKRVHRLVAEEWLAIPEKYKEIPMEELVVDHINGNRQDNRVENLRWCTQQENNNFENYKKAQHNARLGKKYRGKKVLQYDKDKNIVNRWNTLKEASEALGYDYTNLQKAIKNNRIAKECYWEWG